RITAATSWAQPARRPPPSHRTTGPGRRAGRGPARPRVPARILRRYAATGTDRHRAGLRTTAAGGRRTHHRPGRDRAGADPGPPAGHAGPIRTGDPAGHPRPGGGGGSRRPGGGDVRRGSSGTSAGTRLPPPPRPPVQPGADRRRHPRAGWGTGLDPRRPAAAGSDAVRLPVPPSLSVRDPGMPPAAGGAAAVRAHRTDIPLPVRPHRTRCAGRKEIGMGAPLLELRDVTVTFPGRGWF